MFLWWLIEDSFLSSLPALGDGYFIVQTMLLFGYPAWVPGVAFLASCLGAATNALLGRGVRHAMRATVPGSDARFQKAEAIARRYAIPGLLISWTMLGQITVLFAGFLRFPSRQLLAWVILGQAVFFYWMMLVLR